MYYTEGYLFDDTDFGTNQDLPDDLLALFVKPPNVAEDVVLTVVDDAGSGQKVQLQSL